MSGEYIAAITDYYDGLDEPDEVSTAARKELSELKAENEGRIKEEMNMAVEIHELRRAITNTLPLITSTREGGVSRYELDKAVLILSEALKEKS